MEALFIIAFTAMILAVARADFCSGLRAAERGGI